MTLTISHWTKPLRFFDEAVQLVHLVERPMGPAVFGNSGLHLFSDGVNVFRVCCKVVECLGEGLMVASKLPPPLWGLK